MLSIDGDTCFQLFTFLENTPLACQIWFRIISVYHISVSSFNFSKKCSITPLSSSCQLRALEGFSLNCEGFPVCFFISFLFSRLKWFVYRNSLAQCHVIFITKLFNLSLVVYLSFQTYSSFVSFAILFIGMSQGINNQGRHYI